MRWRRNAPTWPESAAATSPARRCWKATKGVFTANDTCNRGAVIPDRQLRPCLPAERWQPATENTPAPLGCQHSLYRRRCHSCACRAGTCNQGSSCHRWGTAAAAAVSRSLVGAGGREGAAHANKTAAAVPPSPDAPCTLHPRNRTGRLPRRRSTPPSMKPPLSRCRVARKGPRRRHLPGHPQKRALQVRRCLHNGLTLNLGTSGSTEHQRRAQVQSAYYRVRARHAGGEVRVGPPTRLRRAPGRPPSSTRLIRTAGRDL